MVVTPVDPRVGDTLHCALVGFSASIALLWDKLAALVTGGGR